MRLVLAQALGADGFELGANIGEEPHHFLEIHGGDADHFHMIKGGTGSTALACAQQPDFPEIISLGKIGEHELTSGIFLADLHKTYADKIKGIGQVALPEDDIARGVAHQLHLRAQIINELGRQ